MNYLYHLIWTFHITYYTFIKEIKNDRKTFDYANENSVALSQRGRIVFFFSPGWIDGNLISVFIAQYHKNKRTTC